MSVFDDAPRVARAAAVLLAFELGDAPRAANAADAEYNGWICGNTPGARVRCLKVARPAGEALSVPRGGVCPRGQVPFGDLCYVLVIPEHAELDASGRAWSCRPGFHQSGASCLAEGEGSAAPASAATSLGERADSGSAASLLERARPGETPRRWICRPGHGDNSRCSPMPAMAPLPPSQPVVAVPGVAGEGSAAPATIERVQRALAALGFDPGALDGVLGDRTREALRAYQTRKGLPATGRTSEDLISTLDADFLHCAVWLPLARSAGIAVPGTCPF